VGSLVAVSTWTPAELEQVAAADELRIASRRGDGSLRPFVTIWAVRAGDDLYVRAAYGPDTGWYRRAKASGLGRIRAGGVERDVAFEPAGPETAGAVTAAFHAKYDRFGAPYVRPVVSEQSEGLTLWIVPV
jgi:hypothetical protein